MLRWFKESAPIRTKFKVLLAIHVMLSMIGVLSTVLAIRLAGSSYDILPVAGAVGACAATVMTVIVSGNLICTPYVDTVVRMERLANGDLDTDIRYMTHKDCVGRMTQAMSRFRENSRLLIAAEAAKEQQASLIVDSIGTALGALARSDLSGRIWADLDGPFAKLKDDFNVALASLSAAMSTVSQATSGINSGTDQVRRSSKELFKRTEQQADRVQQTAAAMEEITTTVKSTAEAAAKANSVVMGAKADAESSGDVVRRTVAAMSDIEKSSCEISEIVSLIDGIAFQTNLLALNAGVEAARAGEAGRGFAVVASEVRALALRSAEAAQNVKNLVEASSRQVGIGVTLVDETGASLKRIITRVNEVNDLVGSIARAAEEQAAALAQVNGVVVEIDSLTRQNAAMVEQSTAAAQSLVDEARGLTSEVSRFRFSAEPGEAVAVTSRTIRDRGRSDYAPVRPAAFATSRFT